VSKVNAQARAANRECSEDLIRAHNEGFAPKHQFAADSTPPLTAVVAHPTRAERTPVRMSAVEPRAGNVAQHPGESPAPAGILIRGLLDLAACTSLAFATRLRVRDGRKGNDPCRKRGEDQFPHDHSPKDVRHSLH
jgi:hypothetical protein